MSEWAEFFNFLQVTHSDSLALMKGFALMNRVEYLKASAYTDISYHIIDHLKRMMINKSNIETRLHTTEELLKYYKGKLRREYEQLEDSKREEDIVYAKSANEAIELIYKEFDKRRKNARQGTTGQS